MARADMTPAQRMLAAMADVLAEALRTRTPAETLRTAEDLYRRAGVPACNARFTDDGRIEMDVIRPRGFG